MQNPVMENKVFFFDSYEKALLLSMDGTEYELEWILEN